MQLLFQTICVSASADRASMAYLDAFRRASTNVILVIQPVPSLRIYHEIFQIIAFLFILYDGSLYREQPLPCPPSRKDRPDFDSCEASA